MSILETIHRVSRFMDGAPVRQIALKFYVPDEITKAVIDKARHDKAALENISISEATATAILAGLMPSVPEAIEPYTKVLLGSSKLPGAEGYSIACVLAELFESNCDGPLGQVRHTNYYGLVDFAYVYLVRGCCWGEEEHMLRLRRDAAGYWRILLGKLEDTAPRTYVERRIDIERALPVWREMLDQLDKGPEPPYPHNYLRMLKDCWDVLFDDTATYRFIGAMLGSTVVWLEDYPEQRDGFRRACEKVMSVWDDPEAERRDTIAAVDPKPSMKTIALAGGDVCRVPSDFFVLDEQAAHSSSFAFACEIYNYQQYNCPNHVLIFADTDITAWRENGHETEALGALAEVYPGLQEGLAKGEPIIFSPLPDGPSCAQKPPCCAAIYRSGWDA